MGRNRSTTELLKPFAVELGVAIDAATPCNVCHGTGVRLGVVPINGPLYSALNSGTKGAKSSYALAHLRSKTNSFKVDDARWLADHHFGGDLAAAIDFRDRLAHAIAAHDEEDKE
jgi:hypothetical protein